jgi:primosomal protein N'
LTNEAIEEDGDEPKQ